MIASVNSVSRYQRIIQIAVDPGLYLASKRGIFVATKRRVLPKQYRFFTGKDLPFIAFCIVLDLIWIYLSILGSWVVLILIKVISNCLNLI